MKYKNYKNQLTGDNRIYSVNEISKMPLSEVLNKKTEILSQFKKIGVPKSLELQNSENVVFVHEYTRDDGTVVKSHWRSKPDDNNIENNADIKAQKEEISQEEQGVVTGGANRIDYKIFNINTKDDYKINVMQDHLINYNDEQNKNYPDARDCMNIAIIGPEHIKNNENYRLLSDEYVKSINSKSGIKLSDNIKTVFFSENSSMANSLNNSQELKQQLKDNINKIENGENIQVSFNKDENLFRSLHNATVFDCKIENGTLTGYIYDKYDFDYQSYNQNHKMNINKIDVANNTAAAIQRINMIKDYNILVPIKIKL